MIHSMIMYHTVKYLKLEGDKDPVVQPLHLTAKETEAQRGQ